MLFFSSAIFFCLLFLQWEVCIYLQTVSIIYMFFWDFSLSTRLQFYSGSLCSRLFQLWVALQLIWVTRATILIGPYLFLSLLCLSASPPFLFPPPQSFYLINSLFWLFLGNSFTAIFQFITSSFRGLLCNTN